MTNLRENIRVRKLGKEIDVTQAEIDAMDMEQAAKARRQFDQKYNVEKQRETEMQSKVCRILFPSFVLRRLTTFGSQYAHIGGELSSLKSQAETLENDLAEFENVNRRYKDQLIKVKVGYSWSGPRNPRLKYLIHRCLTWQSTILRSIPRR